MAPMARNAPPLNEHSTTMTLSKLITHLQGRLKSIKVVSYSIHTSRRVQVAVLNRIVRTSEPPCESLIYLKF